MRKSGVQENFHGYDLVRHGLGGQEVPLRRRLPPRGREAEGVVDRARPVRQLHNPRHLQGQGDTLDERRRGGGRRATANQ
jgi:hypothetical protein